MTPDGTLPNCGNYYDRLILILGVIVVQLLAMLLALRLGLSSTPLVLFHILDLASN